MTDADKLTIAIDSLKRIKSHPETTFGDYWSSERALKTDDIHDIVDSALCAILPIEEIRQELIEQGIDTDSLKSWASERLQEIKAREPKPEEVNYETSEKVFDVTVSHFPYQAGPFVSGWVHDQTSPTGKKSIWLKRDGSWTRDEESTECTLTVGSWFPPVGEATPEAATATPEYHGGFMSPERAQQLESDLAAARADFETAMEVIEEKKDEIRNLKQSEQRLRAALEDMEKKANWNRQIRNSLVKLFKEAGWQDDCTLINELTNMNFDAPASSGKGEG